MIAAAVVHTSGINWESIGTILGGFAAIAAVLVTLGERRQAAIKNEIADSVNHLSEVLQAKLETKDTVNRLSERIARVEANIRSHHDR
jgi:hypothetical protein